MDAAPKETIITGTNSASVSTDTVRRGPAARVHGGGGFRVLRTGKLREITINQLFLLPVALVFIVLFVIPLARTFYWSLTDFNGYSIETTLVGLKNYRIILHDPAMLSGLSFTLIYVLGTTLLITVLAIPLAVLLNERFFARSLVRSIIFFPSIPSLAILGLVWTFILSPLQSGAVNSILGVLGIGPVSWLGNDTLAQLSVIMVAVWSGTGWHAILYLAYLQSIPVEYSEVARIDGATPRQQFFHITLPLLTPAIVVSEFLLITSGLKVYDLPFTLTGGGPGFATRTITQSIVVSGISQAKYGLASALAVMFTVAVGAFAGVQIVASRAIERRVL